ncbi:PIG-L deacetylase family protein [Marinactinospora thermotolerans]|uniref:N-acetylglucosaminyl deacetylase, LmbE family n=1 Tax=Marinactinospora thermotolerans DSM 45154 TaxID=1122192 RepID=A0A1T4T1K4_9ACTN|nr:PIG-L deacetylase family protein [Marinactinospora thermotolerans]SKA34292.1 N-acetylglucosaminyl deacetylase, LmbE family [Marinactinospora thermotolerans DSM 45154]
MTIDWAKERILIFAPHPDDETLGCGGLMSKAKAAGAEVFVQFITVGDTADFSAAGLSTAEERFREIKEVADFYRWDDWNIAFPGDEYHLKLDRLPRFELANAIERHSPLAIAELRPSVVITPHWTSYNQDHRATAEAVHTALRPSDNRMRHHPRLVLAYEEAADQWRYEATTSPNLLVELTEEHLDDKITAMRLYGTQIHGHPHTRSELTLRSLAALRGMQSGVAFAEGYHTLRWLA